MVKFIFKKDGTTCIGLGISAANVALLKEGKPIVVKGDDLNIPFNCEIMIFYGETERAMMQEMGPHIGRNTKIKVDEKLLDPHLLRDPFKEREG